MSDHPARADSIESTWVFTAWLMAAVLLLNLLVVSLALVSLRQCRLQYEERAATQAQNLAEALDHSIAGMVSTVDLGVRCVVDEAERQLAHGGVDAASLNAFISRQQGRLPELDSLRMVDADGFVAYGASLQGGKPVNVADREYFQQLRNDPSLGLFISKPVQSRINGRWVVVMARRVNKPDGSFGGVVYGPIALERISKVLASIDLGSNGGISLRDKEMAIIMRRPSTLGVASAVGQSSLSPEMRRRFEAGENMATFFTANGLEHRAKMVSYRQVGSYPLYVIVALAAVDYLAPWETDRYRMSALVAVFVIVTVILSRYLHVVWRRQKEAERALRSSKEELEQRVVARTGELFAANEQLSSELRERRLAEKRLRRSRNMLAQIIDAIPQSVFWKDRDCVFLGCNIVFARAAGLEDPEQIVGKTDWDFAWRERTLLYQRDDREVMERNSPKFHIIEQVQQADGATLWVDTSKMPLYDERGEVYGVLGVFDDISERKAVQESRDHALALVESLLASSPMGVQVFDGESGRCVKANKSLADMVGATPEALLEQNFRSLKSWQESGVQGLAEEVLVTSATRRIERVCTSTFGRVVSFEWFLSRFDVYGKPHLLAIIVDVAERKRLEQENRQIEAQMLHVQKLESLGVLAGGIAHDFNNILMVVLGNADLALSRVAPGSPVHDNLVQIDNAATRAADLARQMLAYSGKGRFVIEKLDLNRIVEEMGQMIEVSISKKVALRYRLAPDLPALSGDATQLRQVILNLVINASEAIGDRSGSITISTSVKDCDRSYLSDSWIDDALPEGRYLILEVADTGCGMERDIVPKIFDPFFTTKFTGRGLGMAAVLGIVRGHNGAVRVYSEKGQGSTFRILIPAVPGAADQQGALLEPQPLWQGRGTVLLVDDEETIRSLGREMLRELGFSVLTACNGREAIAVFCAKQKEISCVLLDLTMPELDGEQTFRELRRVDPEVRVVISSGYNQQEISERLVGHGLSGFIQKPYKLAEVSRKLQEVLG